MELMRKAILATTLAVLFLYATAPSLPALEVGDKAPDFELESTKGGKLRLSSLRGKNVLIHFYRADFDPT